MEEIKKGDEVRSFDFAESDRYDCYVEGVVEEITGMIEGCARYKIKITKRVFNGVEQEVEPDEYAYRLCKS